MLAGLLTFSAPAHFRWPWASHFVALSYWMHETRCQIIMAVWCGPVCVCVVGREVRETYPGWVMTKMQF